MKKTLLSLAVACALMACNGGAKQQTADNQENTQEPAKQEAAAPKAEVKFALKDVVAKLPAEKFKSEDFPEVYDEFMRNLSNDSIYVYSCYGRGDNGDCQESVDFCAFPKKDGKNYFCTLTWQSGCGCRVIGNQETYNYNAETKVLSDAKADIEPFTVEEFGEDLSLKLVESLRNDVKENRLQYWYGAESFDGKTEFYITADCSFDTSEMMWESEPDQINFRQPKRVWNGEKFVKE